MLSINVIAHAHPENAKGYPTKSCFTVIYFLNNGQYMFPDLPTTLSESGLAEVKTTRSQLPLLYASVTLLGTTLVVCSLVHPSAVAKPVNDLPPWHTFVQLKEALQQFIRGPPRLLIQPFQCGLCSSAYALGVVVTALPLPL